MDGERINWHQAFYAALHMELDEYKDCLEFLTEYQIATEPLRIDALIIKKKPEVVIRKNIGAIFRHTRLPVVSCQLLVFTPIYRSIPNMSFYITICRLKPDN
ncbi:MAG: hypothetical protein LBD20_10095 [Spirochaetaceae bacterium]|jgi:hypothetical protein|nr:hypothetical protein [Spirochaetaceae bacterium]